MNKETVKPVKLHVLTVNLMRTSVLNVFLVSNQWDSIVLKNQVIKSKKNYLQLFVNMDNTEAKKTNVYHVNPHVMPVNQLLHV